MPASRKQPSAGAAARPAGNDEDGASFEESLERLETIVEELEAGSLSLDQSLARYEEGMRLSRRLTRTLDQAEKRIERLVEEEGQPTTRAMEHDPGSQDPGSRDPGEPDPAANDRPGERPAGRAGQRAAHRPDDRPDDREGGEGELPF